MLLREKIRSRYGLTLQDTPEVVIVGCGGLGIWVALYCAIPLLSYSYILIDGDTVDITNLGRLPLPWSTIGKNKAEALRDFLKQLRPFLRVIAIPFHYEPGMLRAVITNTAAIVFDCTDDLETQKFISMETRTLHIRYIKVGAEQDYISLHPETLTETWDSGRQGYQRITVWDASLAGLVATFYASRGGNLLSDLIFEGYITEMDRVTRTKDWIQRRPVEIKISKRRKHGRKNMEGKGENSEVWQNSQEENNTHS